MSLDIFLTLESIEVLENFIDKIRPKEELRDKLDVSYRIENQSIILYEIRPHYSQPGVKIESFVAKATYVKAKNQFNVFWLHSDLKWHSYAPHPTVENIQDFIRIVEADKHGCFWG